MAVLALMKQATEKNPLIGKIIAIDGPAGAGKGTLATNLARVYRMKYLDTGTLYRVVAYKTIQMGGNPAVEEDALKGCDLSDFDFRHTGKNIFCAFLGDKDVMNDIRQIIIGQGASKVAFFPSVRASLKQFQVDFATKWAAEYGVILDGRDIGTVICPGADYKFFLDANADVRAKRRIEELEGRGIKACYQETLSEIVERDARDRGREEAPLKVANDGYLVDSSHKDAVQVLEEVMGIVSIPAAKV
ncbi:MAG: cytidylate kinase [Alphaproteobacteria bacterium]|jgi:cytidylate kinase